MEVTAESRENCVIPGCSAWVIRGYTDDMLEFWTTHFRQRHPQYLDAILGYDEDTVEIKSANGTTALYSPSGLRLKTRPLYIGFSTNGYIAENSMGRHRFTAIGGTFVFSEEPITVQHVGPARVTHYALFDAPNMGLNVTGWRPMPDILTVGVGDTLRFEAGAIKVHLLPMSEWKPAITVMESRPTTAGDPWMVAVANATLNPTRVYEKKRTPVDELGYHVAMHRRAGWIVWVDLEAGGTWQYWRPTRKWADNTGYRRLMREVKRRERAEASENPRSMLMRDIRGTSNDPRALAEWDQQFNATTKEEP